MHTLPVAHHDMFAVHINDAASSVEAGNLPQAQQQVLNMVPELILERI